MECVDDDAATAVNNKADDLRASCIMCGTSTMCVYTSDETLSFFSDSYDAGIRLLAWCSDSMDGSIGGAVQLDEHRQQSARADREN